MKFLCLPIQQLQAGYISAHSIKSGNLAYKKGRRLSDTDLNALRQENISQVTVAILEQNDLHEDGAADFIASTINSPSIETTKAFTGRVNLIAKEAGILTFNPEKIIDFNLIDPAITIATLANYSHVEKGQMLATIKIIPFAATKQNCESAKSLLRNSLIELHPYQSKNVLFVQTTLNSTKKSVLQKTRKTLDERLAKSDSKVAYEIHVPHDQESLSYALKEHAENYDLTIISGASAITDNDDVIPLALKMAGGRITQYGMPVDPGNLLMLGEISKKPIVAMPGCARSPKLNGFDWVLDRIMANIEVTARDIATMSVGGLLKEIPGRPQPRRQTYSRSLKPKISVILLAAGQSRRMGKENKLLSDFKGEALINHAIASIEGASPDELIIVTGHQHDLVSETIKTPNCKHKIVRNDDFADGISTSIKKGLENISPDSDAVLICLGDMPLIQTDHIRSLFAAFSEEDNRHICIPTFNGKWGNPVLIGKVLFTELMSLTGDMGAKPVILRNNDIVCEVDIGHQAVLIDTDTPEELSKASLISN
ncbi:MAG: molybdopterin-binding/glycosyltransferase family 2 protein [Alphaproteobacteria bacterium]|nr:molybdopterin-binding/glycosyltransferase family 2 protein [Alphaproteobacteria bacterium]